MLKLNNIGFKIFAILWVAALALAFVIPNIFLQGTTLTILSGSMRPTLEPGDVIAVQPITEAKVCQDIQVGDVVTFLPIPNKPALITHRVIDIRITDNRRNEILGHSNSTAGCELITRGDANNSPDAPVQPAQVRARMVYRLPVAPLITRLPTTLQTRPVQVLAIIGLLGLGVQTVTGDYYVLNLTNCNQ